MVATTELEPLEQVGYSETGTGGLKRGTSERFALTEYIQKSIDTQSFTGAIVFGKQRVGKSTYGLLTLKQIYGSWDKALDHVYFGTKEVLDLLEKSVKKEEEIKCFLWDDAGIHASKHLFFSDRKRAQMLQGLFDVLGLYVGGIILTTPTPMNLLKSLREYEFFRVKITRKNEYWGRNGLGYQNVLLPSGTQFIKKVFQDGFSCRLPDDVYEQYETRRKKYTEFAVGKLKSYILGEEG